MLVYIKENYFFNFMILHLVQTFEDKVLQYNYEFKDFIPKTSGDIKLY
jgi:hypothetical protein